MNAAQSQCIDDSIVWIFPGDLYTGLRPDYPADSLVSQLHLQLAILDLNKLTAKYSQKHDSHIGLSNRIRDMFFRNIQSMEDCSSKESVFDPCITVTSSLRRRHSAYRNHLMCPDSTPTGPFGDGARCGQDAGSLRIVRGHPWSPVYYPSVNSIVVRMQFRASVRTSSSMYRGARSWYKCVATIEQNESTSAYSQLSAYLFHILSLSVTTCLKAQYVELNLSRY